MQPLLALGASRGEPNLGARVGRSCLAGDGHQQSGAGLGPNTPWKHFVARGDVKAVSRGVIFPACTLRQH